MGKMNLMYSGQMLHAQSIEFVHPTTNEKVKFEAKLPQYFEEVLQKIK